MIRSSRRVSSCIQPQALVVGDQVLLIGVAEGKEHRVGSVDAGDPISDGRSAQLPIMGDARNVFRSPVEIRRTRTSTERGSAVLACLTGPGVPVLDLGDIDRLRFPGDWNISTFL